MLEFRAKTRLLDCVWSIWWHFYWAHAKCLSVRTFQNRNAFGILPMIVLKDIGVVLLALRGEEGALVSCGVILRFIEFFLNKIACRCSLVLHHQVIIDWVLPF